MAWWLQTPPYMRHLSRVFASISLGLLACAAPTEGDDEGSSEAAIEADARLGEALEEGETALVSRIADAAAQQLRDAQRANGGIAKRDAHPKAHGCVTASFTVDPNIPADLRVGTFVPGKRYDAWIRFSNGSKADDRENDARGMAVKVLGAEGQRLLANEDPGARTHDFVLSNHHTFFVSNLTDYVRFMETVVEKGNPLSFFLSWNPFDMHLREGYLAYKFTTQPISNPLTSRYFSVTPYALGRTAVKYAATPCAGADTSGDHPDAADYLSSAMKQSLASGEACFRFGIQKRRGDMPVEDPTVTWDEEESPFVDIATIRIPRQAFDSDAQKTFCENLSFTPWHATKEHRPLGSTNRARKVVYETTSKVRHELNGAPRREPTDLTVR